MTSHPGLPSRVRRRRTLTVLTALSVLGLGVVWSGHSGAQPEHPSASVAPAPSTPSAPGHAARPSRGGPVSVYAHTGVGAFTAATRGVPYRLYVPESASSYVDVVDPVTMKVLGRYKTGLDPQHVVPSYDLRTLWSTNDLANTMTPFDPRTGTPRGPGMAVEDPYNLYFLPGGKEALVVQEQLQRFGFYDAQTMAPLSVVDVHCSGVDHLDFSADERFLVASCEFGHKLLRFDLASRRVTSYLTLPGSAPQDVRLTPDGKLFVVADKNLAGIHLIDAGTFTKVGFLHTGKDAHGIYPSRDGRLMYVSNRGDGTISVLDPFHRRIVATWRLPYGGSPDMGGVSPDGTVLWLAGRYSARIYAISTLDGHLVGTVHIPGKPHGMCVWPQPGRYSLGHTGSMR